MLTRDQLQANINAMEQQGAKPEEIQGYLDSLKPSAQPTAPQNTVTKAGVPLSTRIGSGAMKAANAVTNTLGLKGASDTIATNINNVIHPKLMQAQADDFGQTTKQSFTKNTTTLKQNVGTGVQLGALAGSGAAAPVGVGANVAAGALLGASAAGGQSLSNNDDLGTAAKKSAIGGAVGGLVSGAIAGLGKLVTRAGDKITTSIIKPSKADIADGFSLDTIKKYKLAGNLNTTLQKTQTQLNSLSSELRTKLTASDTPVNLADVFEQTAKELTDESKFKGFGANKNILNVLNNLKEEVGIVGDKLDVVDAQIVKQAAGNFGSWQYGKPDPDSKATEIVFNTFYNKLKVAIEKSSPEGVKAINQEIGKLMPVLNAVIRRLPVAERSSIVSLNEMIGLVGSTVHPAALGPTLLAIISRSGRAGAALSSLGDKVAPLAVPTGVLSGQQAGQGLVPTPEPSQSEALSSPNATPEPKFTPPPIDDPMVQAALGGGMGAGTLAKGAAALVPKLIARAKASPVIFEKTAAFLKQIDKAVDLDAQLKHWDDFEPTLKKWGLDHLSYDDVADILNRVMRADK